MEKSIFSARQEKLQGLLRKMRQDAGLRQNDLAKLIGKPQPFVSKYESGERRLDLLEIHEICNACGVSVVDFARKFEKAIRDT